MALYRAFGLTLDSGFELPGMRPVEAVDADRVSLGLATERELDAAWSGSDGQPTWLTRFPDGNLVRVDTGPAGDQRFEFGALASFWLSPDADRLICAPQDAANPAWQRFLLDTVLWWTALRRGYCLLHACAIDHPMGVIAVTSGMGGGKTTLALELLTRGYPLFCDDVLAMRTTDGEVLGEPGPPFMNVPRAARDQTVPGTPLASLDDEVWLAVDQVALEPRPLGALFVYNRAAGLPLEAGATEASVLDLVPHLFLPAGDLSRNDFDLLSNVADRVPIFRLTAPADASAAAVSDTIESALEECTSKV